MNTPEENKKLKEAGLKPFQYSQEFQEFIAAWPWPLKNSEVKTWAWYAWQRLEKSKALPDVSILLTALKQFPPELRNHPGRWLKNKPWKTTKVTLKCKTCCDEGITYGTLPGGQKGAVPCPECKR